MLTAKDIDTIHDFNQFHTDNPNVVYRLIGLAQRERDSFGMTRVSMKFLFELIRRDHTLTTHSGLFKINNNFTPHYTRMISRMRPDLAPLFRTRAARVDITG